MPSSNREAGVLRFGVFEVNVASGELRKNGARIRMQEQPFQVLTELLLHAGSVVTRDELRTKIWPADTFVDFDHSLNTAVNKIRDALGDSAASPRFVETLARRGYRFVAPVDSVAIPTTLSRAKALESEKAPAVEVALHPELHVPIPRRELVRALFALVQLMYLIFYLNALARLHSVESVVSRFLYGGKAQWIVGGILITGVIGIPLRLYLISAIAFDFRKLGAKFARLFPFVLALDQLWALTPFLLLPQIGVGLTFAAVAALLYVPFAERTLIRMAYRVDA